MLCEINITYVEHVDCIEKLYYDNDYKEDLKYVDNEVLRRNILNRLDTVKYFWQLFQVIINLNIMLAIKTYKVSLSK